MTVFDVIVIGGGPGGYSAAVRCSQLGLNVALVEKDHLGGTCVNWGCIPTKALLRNAEIIHLAGQGRTYGFRIDNLSVDYSAAHKRSRQVSTRQSRRVEALLKTNQVQVVAGTARFKSPTELEISETGNVLTARHIIVATGTVSRLIPGVKFDGETVITFRNALETTECPKTAVIVGAGPIGLEFATVWSRYGSKVTVVEMMPRILPLEDEDVSRELEKQFKRNGVQIMTDARVETVTLSPDGGAEIAVTAASGTESIKADKVLVAIGFMPNTENLALEAAGVSVCRTGIEIDDRMRTSAPNIYAIGDVTGKLGLAHTASAQGVIASEAIAGMETRSLDYALIPRCTFTDPETASVGLTEKQAAEAGFDIIVKQSPFVPNGKALALGENVGFVKFVADANTKNVLGVHMIGPHVTELIAGPAALMSLGATADQMALGVYPHPTLSEAVMEGIHALAGRAIHVQDSFEGELYGLYRIFRHRLRPLQAG